MRTLIVLLSCGYSLFTFGPTKVVQNPTNGHEYFLSPGKGIYKVDYNKLSRDPVIVFNENPHIDTAHTAELVATDTSLVIREDLGGQSRRRYKMIDMAAPKKQAVFSITHAPMELLKEGGNWEDSWSGWGVSPDSTRLVVCADYTPWESSGWGQVALGLLDISSIKTTPPNQTAEEASNDFFSDGSMYKNHHFGFENWLDVIHAPEIFGEESKITKSTTNCSRVAFVDNDRVILTAEYFARGVTQTTVILWSIKANTFETIYETEATDNRFQHVFFADMKVSPRRKSVTFAMSVRQENFMLSIDLSGGFKSTLKPIGKMSSHYNEAVIFSPHGQPSIVSIKTNEHD